MILDYVGPHIFGANLERKDQQKLQQCSRALIFIARPFNQVSYDIQYSLNDFKLCLRAIKEDTQRPNKAVPSRTPKPSLVQASDSLALSSPRVLFLSLTAI